MRAKKECRETWLAIPRLRDLGHPIRIGNAARVLAPALDSARLPWFLPLCCCRFRRRQRSRRFALACWDSFIPGVDSATGGRQVLSVAAQGAREIRPWCSTASRAAGRSSSAPRATAWLPATRSAGSWTAAARDGGAAAFRLTVPGKISSRLSRRLTIQARNGELLAVVAMDRETAVASIVAAEMAESAPMEALKAQAVVTRSFLTAGPRHLDFDFCDTTHCQFLKSPPPFTSRVTSAVQATRGLVLAYRGKPLAAMYSSRCGGQTRSLRDVGLNPGETRIPYYSVRCQWCRRHPATWQSKIGASGQPPSRATSGEGLPRRGNGAGARSPAATLRPPRTARAGGWKATAWATAWECARWAQAGMAAAGAGFREILSHYYPNTELISQP
jgi:hypothetical protein